MIRMGNINVFDIRSRRLFGILNDLDVGIIIFQTLMPPNAIQGK